LLAEKLNNGGELLVFGLQAENNSKEISLRRGGGTRREKKLSLSKGEGRGGNPTGARRTSLDRCNKKLEEKKSPEQLR